MESFFYTAEQFDAEEIVIAISHIGYEFASDLPIVILCKTIEKIKENERKEEIRQQWVAMLPMMSSGTLKYKSFDEYYDQCTGKNIDCRPSSEILNEAHEIRKELRKEK